MNISRRRLITTGVAAAAGVAGLAAASRIARQHSLIPPDGCSLYGPGETLTYAAQRLLTRHSLAREFPRSMISKTPFRNETAPPSDAFKRHQAANFADWRLTVDGVLPSWRAATEKLPASTTRANTAMSGSKAKSSVGFI